VLVLMQKQRRSEPIPQLPISFSASSAYALWFSAGAVAVLPATNTTVVRTCTAARCRTGCPVFNMSRRSCDAWSVPPIRQTSLRSPALL
jgi:hypothetical protein